MAALSTTNARRTVFGDMNITLGEFTFTEAGAAATIGVEGAWVLAMFHSQDATGAMSPVPLRYSVSTSGQVSTITVYGQEGITTGKFLIIHK